MANKEKAKPADELIELLGQHRQEKFGNNPDVRDKLIELLATRVLAAEARLRETESSIGRLGGQVGSVDNRTMGQMAVG